jgi:hypothetical protein
MTTILRLLIVALLVVLTAPAAVAHTQSYSFLSLTLGPASAEGRLELAVRDLDRIHDLDADRDGKITWGEFRRREHELLAAALAQVAIGGPDAGCNLTGEEAMTDLRGGETYIVIPFRGACPPHAGPVTLGYDLMFASDAQHRGLVAVTTQQGTRSFVMTPAAARVELDAAEPAGLAGFISFIGHGAHHISIGYDHILFLLTLLIGAFAMRGLERTLRERLYEAVKVVTAFTVAHSLTLGLAAFGLLSLPAALTESLIAITITLAALNNIWPLVSKRLWIVAFGFGLVHGLGFANMLAELEMPRENLLAALFAFNLGVELGQLAILFAVLPVIILFARQLAARRRSFGRFALPTANLAIAAIGALWFTDRAFGSALMPF